MYPVKWQVATISENYFQDVRDFLEIFSERMREVDGYFVFDIFSEKKCVAQFTIEVGTVNGYVLYLYLHDRKYTKVVSVIDNLRQFSGVRITDNFDFIEKLAKTTGKG